MAGDITSLTSSRGLWKLSNTGADAYYPQSLLDGELSAVEGVVAIVESMNLSCLEIMTLVVF